MAENDPNRRDFIKTATGVGATLGVAAKSFAARPGKGATGRVVGPNDRINVAVIGVGGRGSYLAQTFAGIGERTNDCKVVAVCDVYEKRKKENAERLKAEYRYQFLIKATSRKILNQLLKHIRTFAVEHKWGATALVIDVDPLTLM